MDERDEYGHEHGYGDGHEYGYGDGFDEGDPQLIDAAEAEYLGAVDAVARVLEEEFGPGRTWPWAWSRRATIAECIIDAVFSVRARTADVERILDRWRRWQDERGVAVETAWDLAAALHHVPGLTDDTTPPGEGPAVFPRNRIAGRRKTRIAKDAATALDNAGIVDLESFRRRLQLSPMALRNEWMFVHGLGETTFCHMRLLVGSEVLDPGVRVLRYLGTGRAVSVSWAKDVIVGVADAMGVPPVPVEYALSLLAGRRHVGRGGATAAA